MEANENKVTRKGSTPIKVYCLPDERAAIDMLTVAGYAVVRQRTYDGLRERVTKAHCL